MKVPVFIYSKVCPFSKELEVRAYPSKSEMWGGNLVAEREIEIDEPDYGDALNSTIKSMRDIQKDIRAKAQSQVERIEESIQQMLSIENKEAA
tara:strand:+ start:5106 stop:5384 length:279 start_codon:yes stop_codon:yes gene_type:complete